ncbi:MAG: hypothetical protein NTU88_01390 [Armatimonadetes bacterium]|nr:hypothetical protein [Armatimonadota bacterium]
MSRFVVIGLALLAACFPAPVGAVGKTTVDPNSVRPASADKTPAKSSADTSQKVTYEARRKTVVSILEDLTKMTGVTMRAGWNVEDWQVRDRRMNIFVKDIPLSNLMNSIARVMKFKWSKSEKDDGTVSYRLYMDRNTLLGAERERYVEEQELGKKQAEARQRLLSELERAASMSEDELENSREKSPYIYAMVKRGWNNLLPGLFNYLPATKQAILSGESQFVDIGSLPPELQQAAGKCLPLPPGAPLERCLQINTLHSEQDAVHICSLAIATNGLTVGSTLLDPDSESAKAQGEYFAEMMSASTPDDKMRISARYMDKSNQNEKAENKDLGEPVIEHPDDPELSAKINMKTQWNDTFEDTLEHLHKSSGFSVVSDCFNVMYPRIELASQKSEVRDALNELESKCRYNWERHGSVIELHDRDWFRKRSAQIPEAWLDAWRKAFVDTCSLDMNELSQIASLTPDQFLVNVSADDVLGNSVLGISIDCNRDILRFYASLDKHQKASMWTDQGLSLGSLSDHQLQESQALLQRISALQTTSVEDLRLRGNHEKSKERPKVTFEIVRSTGEATGIRWDIYCPVYYPPAKDKPKDDKPQQVQEKGSKQ